MDLTLMALESEVDDARGGGDGGVGAGAAHTVGGGEHDVLGVERAATAHGETDHERELALRGGGAADDGGPGRAGGWLSGAGLEAERGEGDRADGRGSLERA